MHIVLVYRYYNDGIILLREYRILRCEQQNSCEQQRSQQPYR